ncbi:MAG: hypothetical protein OQJ96_12875 [Flavobacteriales bacterium]|nr:hypothetical protein [Flavobacteriales bacterium]MCW8912880.1 hypothetical protein [Flavobacteriales bacterium]MCW8937229.1 hypothetical protein [Flavobacteriales bacterium]MCW8939371.1 hypothetical protein [Flavobacteriales bacterium]MCW8967810.1 hypothetical protein [Flavobacteriales bacterium]
MTKKVLLILLSAFIFNYTNAQVQIDKFSGDAYYSLPLMSVPNFKGPSISTSIIYKSDVKVDQPASEIGLGWNIEAGGSIERSVNGIPDDWIDVQTADLTSASFQKHLGALYFNKTNTSTVLDFDYTRFKLDSLNDTIRFYYPNYDSYYVTGAGMAGEITPENYDYATVKVDTSSVRRWFYYSYYLGGNLVKDSIEQEIRQIETYSINSVNNLFNYKTHFRYNHNNYAETNSRYFPWNSSPLTTNSDVPIYRDSIGGSAQTFNGAGYNDENFTHTENRNRSRTANYITYYTNAEIAAGINGFLEYKTLINRAVTADFPTDGIGAYQITDINGYTYHYSLPVYAFYNIQGTYSLDKDHNISIAEGGTVEKNEDLNGSYLLENDYTHEILETNKNIKYAIRWLLTAVTGPDFKDTNQNGVVDSEDEGYWVKYDYGLWASQFENRFPYYGANYAFTADIEQGLSAFMDENDKNRNSGKILAYSETAEEKYYLNKIQTPSHSALFIRDYRLDEQSASPYPNNYEYVSTENLKSVSDTLNFLNGSGDFNGFGQLSPSILPKYYRFTIMPEGVDSVKLFIDKLWGGNYGGQYVDTFTVYDGPDSTGTILYQQAGNLATPTSVTSSSNAITIEYVRTTQHISAGEYTIRWESKWKNDIDGWPGGRPKNIPELKLSKMLLFDNHDLDSLPNISAIDTILNDKLWDYQRINKSSCYNNTWFESNDSIISYYALQSTDLIQDYSLAKKYINNKNVYVDIHKKPTSQIDVEANKYIATNQLDSSGKLTLNKIVYHGLNRTQSQPAHIFDYDAEDTLSNPYYNTLKQDYWGNYKNDAEDNLLRGYVTDSSIQQVDAWSLRKITTPLGAVTELIYEADEYEQVLKEYNESGLRGPSKIFALTSVVADSNNLGTAWFFDIENQEDDFWATTNSFSGKGNKNVVVPGIWINPDDSSAAAYYYQSSLGDDFHYGTTISFGSGTLSSSPNKVSNLNYNEINIDAQPTPPITNYPLLNVNEELVYGGEGYIVFNYNKGQKIYGGGTRVKETKVYNDTTSYTTKYTYDLGTATAEPSDFWVGKTKTDDYDTTYYWGAVAFDIHPFGLAPQVGYSSVTVENRGEVASGQGKSVYEFYVSDENHTYLKPYTKKIDTTYASYEVPACAPHVENNEKRFGLEIIDDFTSMWGKISTQKVVDIHNNIISKKIYEYTVSTKGAHVNTINFEVNHEEESSMCVKYHAYIPTIFRKYPTYVNKIITYSNGRKSESTIAARDAFTAGPTETGSISVNKTTTKEEIIHAYTQTSTPNYQKMGAKSDNPENANFLGAVYAAQKWVASEGVTTEDFLSYGKSFWKDSARVFKYDDASNEFMIISDTTNWYDYTQYAWAGELGDYGIFKYSAFTDINTPPSGTSDWRFLSEVTLMDKQQNVLEQKSYGNRFSANKLGYDSRFAFTSASNSNYVSFTATGFETINEVATSDYFYEGEVKVASGNLHLKEDGTVLPHTGNYMVKIPAATNSGPIYTVKYNAADSLYSLQRGRTYTASVWVHKDSPDDVQLVIDLDGTSNESFSATQNMRKDNSKAITIGDWIQLTVSAYVPEDFLTPGATDGVNVYVKKTSSADAWVDDLQFKSNVSASGMSVYDQRTGRVMATLSDNNFATKYVYNDAGQITEVWQEVLGDSWGKWVKVESREYNFKRAME